MKTKIVMFIVLILVYKMSAQEGWFWQNPLPQGNRLESIFFIDEHIGWTVGSYSCVLKTTDGGNTWNKIYIEQNYSFTCVLFMNENVGWITGQNGVILKSTDGGLSWFNLNSGTTKNLSQIIINDSMLWVIGSGIILKSEEMGNNWTELQLGSIDPKQVYFYDSNHGWIAGRPLFKTIDGGQTWQSLPFNGLMPTSIAFSDLNIGWICANIYSHVGGLHQTTFYTLDNGNSWTEYPVGVNFVRFVNNVGWMNDKFYWEKRLLRTTDGGLTWNILSNSFSGKDIFFINENIGWAVGALGLILKSTNGGIDWIKKSSGNTSTLVSSCFYDQNIGWAVGDNGVIIKTTDSGNNWLVKTSGTDTLLNSIHFYNENIGYAVGDHGTILSSTNGGESWARTNLTNNHFRGVYTFDENNTIIVGTSGNILKTTNGGTNWNIINIGSNHSLNNVIFNNDSIGWASANQGNIFKTTDMGITWQRRQIGGSQTFLSIFFTNELVGWVGGNEQQLYKTSDGGESWIPIAVPITINSIFFVNENIGWISGSNGNIYKTTNSGINWINQASFTYQNIYSLNFVEKNMGWAFGAYGTILKTITGGVLPVELSSFTASIDKNNIMLSWSTASETNNLGFEIERSFNEEEWITRGFISGSGTTTEEKSYSYHDELFANGKYQYRLKQVDFDGSYEYSNVVEIDFNFIRDYNLFQNYPNPFNPTTIIKYSISSLALWERVSEGRVRVLLKVYDVLGNEVSTLVNEEKPLGEYEVEFDGSKLSSGVYFYQLRAGSFIQTKKMILMR
jgi:photosystem II stability/assembly factor-like uncharacterized protein